MRWQRPETHQNLIHPDKEQRPNSGTQTVPLARFIQPTPTAPITFASRDTSTYPRLPMASSIGGDDRVRTDDPLLAKQVLSQLSYAPLTNGKEWWAREDLNLRPHAYQACALTS
jgi:hypothetical protein